MPEDNAAQWNRIKKHPDKARKMLSALHMSPAYMKVSWNDLDEGEQKKISSWIARNGSGWFETAEPTPTPAGVKNVAPEHRKAAIKKESAGVMRTPMQKEESVRTAVYEDLINRLRDAKTFKEVGEVNQAATLAEMSNKITFDQLQQIYAMVHEKDNYLERNNDTVAATFKLRIDEAKDVKDIGMVLREVNTSTLSTSAKTELEKYAKHKHTQIFQAQQRSYSDLSLVNEFKSKIEYAGDIDRLNELTVEVVDNVANGNFERGHVIQADVNLLHELIDDKITRLYREQIGTTDDFSKKTPMNLIVISTEMNRLRDLNKRIQSSYLNQTRKDNLEIAIHSKLNEIQKLKPRPDAKPLDEYGRTNYESLKSGTDLIMLAIAEFTTREQIDAMGGELKKVTQAVGSTGDPKVQELMDNILKIYNLKRRQIYGTDTPTKVIRTAEEYEIKNLEYEAKNKPAEMCATKKEYDDVTKYSWGVLEAEAIKKFADGKLRQLQSNLDYVAKQKAELEEIVRTKPHVLLTKVQIQKRFPNGAEAEEKMRDMWAYKSKKADYDKNADGARFWQDKVDKIKSGDWQKLNENSLKAEYIKHVKDAIKHGKPVPYEVIKQYPEFTKSQNSRERYDKGRHTSFANVSIAVDTRHKENHGIKIKLQDGSPMEDKYADDIVNLISQYQSVIGDITPVFKQEDVTIAHTKGKHPFLSTAAGCYSPIEKTVTLGRRGVGSHELSHFIDETAKHRHNDLPLYDYALLATARKNMNGGVERAISLSPSKEPEELEDARELRFRLGTYWKRPEELFARLMEQYTAYKTKGQNAQYLHYPYEEYVKTPAYWDDESFRSMIPQIEAELNRKIALAKD